jgi:DNA-binding transcriptional LysR family regulator
MPNRHETQGLLSRITALFDRHNIQPNIAQREVWMFHTIIALVAAEVGAAIVPSAITAHRTQGVAYRTLLPLPDTVHLMLTWHRDEISTPLTNFLRLATPWD